MEKVYYVRKIIPKEEIPKNIEIHEPDCTGSTRRVLKYKLDRIESNSNDKDFVKVVFKTVS